jgi:23S rRNA (cytidine1920-2'-O)/16S rRNA (cytidine1409-2'-O)-methyltransferase
MTRIRIDRLLVQLGHAPSRERAQALVMAGRVLVDEVVVHKAGATVRPDAPVRVRGDDNPFVSRGGIKLDGAIDDLAVDVAGRTVLDVGSSTGGFTDCVLRRGANRVYAVDVGTNQLAFSLRSLEQTNARHLEPGMLPGLADLAVIDVSFISLSKILGPVAACLAPGGEILALVKPQFEVGPERVGKGGVVRDDDARAEAVLAVIAFAAAMGFSCAGRTDSRIKGPKGNQETFVRLVRPPAPGGDVP